MEQGCDRFVFVTSIFEDKSRDRKQVSDIGSAVDFAGLMAVQLVGVHQRRLKSFAEFGCIHLRSILH
jgi:hypothetical protein